MTAAVATAPRSDLAGARTTLPRVIRSEWTKLWSLRSTYWTLLTMIVVSIGFTALGNWGVTSSLDKMSPHELADLDPVASSLWGIGLGQLALAVLGALTISSEYSTGGIKATLAAVPQRLHVLTAKAVVFLVTALVAGMATVFASYGVAMLFWSHYGMAVSLSAPGALRTVAGGGLVLVGCGMIGFAVAALLRHTAGAITTAVGLLLVVPILSGLLPGSWGEDVNKVFTVNAAQNMLQVKQNTDFLAPWTGFLVFTAEWLALLIIGAVLMRRRDA